MIYNKADFKKHIEKIQIEGFKLKSAVQAYLFVRKQSDRIETITVSYRSYAPHGFYIDGISANIYFPEVEDLLEKYSLREEYKSTFSKAFQDLREVEYDKLTIEINSNESFEVVKNVVEDIIQKGVLPFLSHFSTLREIASFLAEKQPVEIVPFIQGSILYPKTVLIMKLAKHPNFQKRLLEFRNILSENIDESPRYPILLGKYDLLFSEYLKEV